MRKLVERKVRGLWEHGYDEGLRMNRPGSEAEQQEDGDYKIRWIEPRRHPTCPQQIVLRARIVDESFNRFMGMLSGEELLAWLDGMLCQKYR